MFSEQIVQFDYNIMTFYILLKFVWYIFIIRTFTQRVHFFFIFTHPDVTVTRLLNTLFH